MFLKRSGFGVHTSLSKTRPISMVPCERKADLDEFEPGLEFVRSRVNGVIESSILMII